MKEERAKKEKNYYPDLIIHKNVNPNRFFAIPLVGFLVKIVLLIPVGIEAIILGIIFFFLWVINSFVILFTGKYWGIAYDFFLGLMQFWVKIYLYIFGLIDTYPGFGLSSDKLFELHMPKPEHPNRMFAIPLFGFIARIILLIPYFIFSQVMRNGSWVAMIISWFPVLVYGKFPETTYEFESDTMRVSLAAFCYITGLSDTYPSFSISMNHQTLKILLIIAGALLTVNNFKGQFYRPQQRVNNYNYRYYRYRQNNLNMNGSTVSVIPSTQLPSITPKPTLTSAEIISNFDKEAQNVTVSNIYKSPNSYKGKAIIFTCSVSSFPKDDNGDVVGLNCTDPNDFNSYVQVGIDNKNVDVLKINENDSIKVYGMGMGAVKGQNGFGANVTTGAILGLYINDLTTSYKNY